MASRRAHAEKPHLRIVLVGKTGTGKSAAGNTILGERFFTSRLSFASVTQSCRRGTSQFDGQKLTVVDTPGLSEIERDPEELKNELIRCYLLSSPGPHVFLVVSQAGRFTKEEQDTVKFIQKVFGKESSRYTLALFTHGDALEEDGVTIEEIFDDNQALTDFISQCGGGYHVFNNKTREDSQVRELLKKINTMVENNGGSYYTNETFENAEKAIKERMEQIQRDNPNLTPEEARKQAEESEESEGFAWKTFLSAILLIATMILRARACVIQ